MKRLLLCAIPLGLFPLLRGAAPAAPLDVREVTLEGKDLPSLLGVPIEKLGMVRYGEGGEIPIPFQVDERGPGGRYVLKKGKAAGRDVDRGALDANDELVFLARDLGERLPAGRRPPEMEGALEIEVAESGKGPKGWVYLGTYAGTPPKSRVDYVRYSPAKDRVYSDVYIIGYTPGKKCFYPNLLYLLTGPAARRENLIDRQRTRIEIRLLFGLVPLRRNEEDMRAEVIGYTDGPVRVIRTVESSVYLALGLHAPKVRVDSLYYRSSHQSPGNVNAPFDFDKIASKGHTISGIDYSPEAVGLLWCNSRNRGPITIDGKMSPEEANLDRGEYDWAVVNGPQGVVFSYTVFPPSMPLKKELAYLDDIEALDPPEGCPGTVGFNGFYLDLMPVKKGRHTFWVYLYFPENLEPGKEEDFYRGVSAPLEVGVHPMAGEGKK